MTYICKVMTFNINIKQRRLHSNNFYSFGKSSCRVAVTPRTLGSPIYSFFHNQVGFSSSSTKALKETVKIHFRTFSSPKSCWNFRQKLKKKFNKFSNKKLKIYKNFKGNKIRYFCVEKEKIEDIK